MSPLALRRTKTQEVDQQEPPDLPDVPDERPFPGFVRVNLLPDAILERAKVQRIKRFIAVLLVLVLLLLAGLWYMAQRDLAAAEEQLTAAELQKTQLQGEIAQYAEVPIVFATASVAQESMTTAMSREVRWAFLLNQLSFATPAGVKLNSIGGALTEGGPVETSPGGVLPPKESVGTMTFAGSGSSFSEVAAWLDSLTTLKDYTYPFLTNSTKGATTGADPAATGGSISWESTADLSPNALSGRYGTPAPVAPADPGVEPPVDPAPIPVPDGAAQ